MSVTVQIPRILTQYARGEHEFEVHGNSVAEALADLKQTQPSVYVCICDETGRVRQHINLFLNDEPLTDLKTRLGTGDVISVFQSVSGG